MATELEKIPARFKTTPEDFIVEELAWDWKCKISEAKVFNQKPDLKELDTENPKDFLLCEFEKKDIDNFRAKKEFASEIRKGVDALGFAGIKDKKAHTCQRVSIFKPDLEKIKNFKHQNIYIKNFKWNKRKIKLGYLEGNRFTVILRDIDSKSATKITNKIRKTDHFSNYFGKQRFGSVRANNAKVGYLLAKKKFEEAIDVILTETSNKERPETTESRKNLKEHKNYKRALDEFPVFLKFERGIINYLMEKPGDYIGAIKRCERKTFLLYMHALQSKLFNEILEVALSEEIDFTQKGQMRIPLFGYKSKFDEGELGEIEQEILNKNNIELDDFRIPEIPYLSLKGDYRIALIKVNDIETKIDDDDMYEGSKKITLRFSLPSGVYATTFLENFFDLLEEKTKD